VKVERAAEAEAEGGHDQCVRGATVWEARHSAARGARYWQLGMAQASVLCEEEQKSDRASVADCECRELKAVGEWRIGLPQ
jgi:hypothetical protein